jgi:hypothetical protein
VTPDEPQYAAVMRGESVPPEPVNAKPRKVEAAVTAPAWTTPEPATGTVPWATDAAPAPTSAPTPAAPATPNGAPAWLKG